MPLVEQSNDGMAYRVMSQQCYIENPCLCVARLPTAQHGVGEHGSA